MSREITESSEPLAETDEKFLGRWSRLKQQSALEESDASSEQLQTQQPEPEKALTDEDMPDIDSLTPDSDYTGFLSPQVSESLRRLALRKLFRGAQFNVRDGLDDYDQDFTSFAKLGDVITADMKHMLEQEMRRAEERNAAAEAGEAETEGGKEAEEEAGQSVEDPSEPVAAESEVPEELNEETTV